MNYQKCILNFFSSWFANQKWHFEHGQHLACTQILVHRWGPKTTCRILPLFHRLTFRGTQRQFLENVCSEGDLRSRIFGTFFFVVKFLACLPLLGFSNPPPPQKKWYNCPFLMDLYPKKVTYNFREPFSWLKFSKKVSFDPYNFWITRLSGRKSEQMKYF